MVKSNNLMSCIHLGLWAFPIPDTGTGIISVEYFLIERTPLKSFLNGKGVLALLLTGLGKDFALLLDGDRQMVHPIICRGACLFPSSFHGRLPRWL